MKKNKILLSVIALHSIVYSIHPVVERAIQEFHSNYVLATDPAAVDLTDPYAGQIRTGAAQATISSGEILLRAGIPALAISPWVILDVRTAMAHAREVIRQNRPRL